MSLILLLLICLSGSVIGCGFDMKNTARMIPVTIMASVLILYISGIFRIMSIGVYLIIVLSIVSCFLILSKLIFRRIYVKDVIKELFVPSIPFIVLFFLIAFLTKDLQRSFFDEFYHWGNVVKAMFYGDWLSTDPLLDVYVRSYPPAMSLWQYLIQKINLIGHPGNTFVEWRMYFGYQVFCAAMVLPIQIIGKCVQAGFIIFMSCVSIGIYISFFDHSHYTSDKGGYYSGQGSGRKKFIFL